MRYFRFTASLALTAALTAACAPDGVTSARVPDPPSFDLDPSAPVPQIISATVVGRLDNTNSMVRIVFTDNATDEWLTSAYFTPTTAWGSAVTQNIEGTASTGERTVDLPAPTGYTAVRLHYAWKSSTGLLWSPFSPVATIGGVTTSNKRRGGN